MAPVTDDEVAEQGRFVYPRLERMMREQRRGVLLVNNDPDATLTASQRRAIMDGNRKHEELLRRACLGIGIVIHSPVQRGVLTAMMWLLQTPTPVVPFGSFVEADHWARRQLDRASVSVPGPG